MRMVHEHTCIYMLLHLHMQGSSLALMEKRLPKHAGLSWYMCKAWIARAGFQKASD